MTKWSLLIEHIPGSCSGVRVTHKTEDGTATPLFDLLVANGEGVRVTNDVPGYLCKLSTASNTTRVFTNADGDRFRVVTDAPGLIRPILQPTLHEVIA